MSILTDNTDSPYRRSVRGEPAWEIATLFPAQGTWTEEAYLALPSNRLMELNDGCLEILPMPTYFHELIVEFLYDLLRAFARERGLGKVMRAPLPIRLWPRTGHCVPASRTAEGTGKVRESEPAGWS